MTNEQGEDKTSTAPNQRTFSLNSQEFYEVLCEPRERPWIVNGALPSTPRGRNQEVIVDSDGARWKIRKR